MHKKLGISANINFSTFIENGISQESNFTDFAVEEILMILRGLNFADFCGGRKFNDLIS